MTVVYARLLLPLRACTRSRRRHRQKPLRPWRSPVQAAPPLTLPCFVTVPNVGTCCALRLAESPPRSPLLPTSHVLAGSSPCYGSSGAARLSYPAGSLGTNFGFPRPPPPLSAPAPWAPPTLLTAPPPPT